MAKKKPAKKAAKKAKKSGGAKKASAKGGAKKAKAKGGAKKAKAKPAKKSSAKSAAKKPAKSTAKKPAESVSDVVVDIIDVVEVAFSDVGSGPAVDTSANAETEAAQFLKDYDDGNIDNAWDVIGDLAELDKRLSKSSPLRPAFDKMYGEMETICRESSGG